MMSRDHRVAHHITAVAVAGASAAVWAQSAPFTLPAPTGSYPVGTTTWHLADASRRDPVAPDRVREVEVHAWYPAAANASGSKAPYLREGLQEVRTFARNFGAETTFDNLEAVQTHSMMDAPVAGMPGLLPVLLFSLGYTGIPAAYPALLEDLASHGYAVLSVVHPYEATAAKLADGRVVTMLGPDGKPVPPVAEVLDEWGPEDETMAAVTRSTDSEEQRKLLRGYIGKIPRTDAALRRWVDDTRLVLDRLAAPERGSAAARLASRLDLSRVGVFGHSMGGVTAAEFCLQDRRCRAGLNLDGIPQYGGMIDASTSRPFLMVYSARPGRLGASDSIYRRAARPYYRVDVPDTRHLDFCDMAFWGGPLRARPILGPIDPVRATAITRAVVRRYFDQEVLKKEGTLVAALRAFPEVMFRSLSPPGR